MAKKHTWRRPFTHKCVSIIQDKLGINLTDEQIEQGGLQFIHQSRWSFRGQGLVSIERENLGPLGGPANQVTLTIKQPYDGITTVEELKKKPNMGVTVLVKHATIQNMTRLFDELAKW